MANRQEGVPFESDAPEVQAAGDSVVSRDVEIAENEPIEPPSTGHEEEEEILIRSLADAAQRRAEANAFIKNGEFDKGTDRYSRVAQFISETYGPTSFEAAEAYFDYGEALVYKLQETDAVLAGDVEDEDDDADEGEDKKTKESSAELEQNGEMPKDSDGKSPSGAERKKKEFSDGRIAWESLEHALQLYENKLALVRSATNPFFGGPALATSSTTEPSAEAIELKLAKTHMALGDLSMENETFNEAIEDYNQCLAIRQRLLPDNDRDLARVRFQLGLAHEALGNLPQSKEHFAAALAVYQKREDEESQSISKDLALKIEDVEAEMRVSAEEQQKVKDMLRESIAAIAPSSAEGGQTTPDAALSSFSPLDLLALGVPQLRALAAKHHVDISACVEKAELVQALSRAAAASRPVPAAAPFNPFFGGSNASSSSGSSEGSAGMAGFSSSSFSARATAAGTATTPSSTTLLAARKRVPTRPPTQSEAAPISSSPSPIPTPNKPLGPLDANSFSNSGNSEAKPVTSDEVAPMLKRRKTENGSHREEEEEQEIVCE